MARRVRIRDRNQIPNVVEKMETLNGRKVQVGVFGQGKMKMIAEVHEFGTNIAVTPKMRGYLAAKGLYLKKETTHIRIPERSFIRAGWDENEKEILDKVERLIRQAATSGVSVEDVLDGTGLETQGHIQRYTRDLRDPANHPFTVEQKGSSNPLVDTGHLVQSISYVVE